MQNENIKNMHNESFSLAIHTVIVIVVIAIVIIVIMIIIAH